MKLKLLCLLSILTFNAFSQSPKLINYQGAARRTDGSVIGNRVLGVKFEIIEGAGTGTVVGAETQTVNTNVLGLFSTQIGKSGLNFAAVNWQNAPHRLQISIDTTGGISNFIGTFQNQITSTPFAFNADDVPSTYTNNILTIGKSTYTIVSAVTPSINTQGLISSTNSGSSFTLNVPNPTLSLNGSSLSINNGNTITLPSQTSQTIVPQGALSLTAGLNSFTLSTPAQISQTITGNGMAVVQNGVNTATVSVPNPTLSLSSNSLSINGGNTVVLPGQIAQTITAQGIASVSNGVNSATVLVANPVLSNTSNILSISQGTAVSTVTLPAVSSASFLQSGVIGVTTLSANSYSLNVPAPVLSNTANVLSISQGTAISTVTIPITHTILGVGLASVSPLSGTAFTVSVPNPSLSNIGGSITLSQGTLVSSVALPVQTNQTITGLGIVNAGSVSANSFTVSVPNPSLSSNANSITITQGSVVSTATIPTAVSQTISVLGGLATVTNGVNSASITIPSASLSSSGNSLTLTNGTVITTATVPLQTTQTITGVGIASVTSPASNSFVVTVNQPTFAYSQTNGSLTSGTSSANITPSLSLSGTTLTSGPASNSINFSALTPWSQSGGTVSLLTSSNIVSIGANTPSLSNTGLLLGRNGAFDNRMVITGGDNSNSYGGMLTITENQNQTQGMTLKMDATANRFLITSDPTGTNYVMGIGGYSGINQGVSLGNGYALNNPPANGMIVQGNVGIGTAAPTATLHVVGTSRFVDGTEGAGKVLTSDASGNATWSTSTSGWGLTGNAGTTPSLNFIGTTDNKNLNFKVNNQNAGAIDYTNQNTFFGYLSGSSSPTTQGNTAIGTNAGKLISTGGFNTALGWGALTSNTSGQQNVSLGFSAMSANVSGGFNSIVGMYALTSNTSGSSNSALGWGAGYNNTGNNNVFLGNSAGYYETGSNKLYISNSTTSTTPLIYGDFSTGRVGINTNTGTANFQVNGTMRLVDGTEGAGKILISDASGNASWSAASTSTFAYSQTNGSLTSGTASTYITPSLALSGYTISSGPASNSINLSSISPWSQTGGTVALNTSTSNVGIGVSNPTNKLAVSSTTTTPNFAQYTTLNFNPSTNPGGAAGAGYFSNNFNGTGGTQLNTAITGYLSLAGGASSSAYNTGAWLHGISAGGSHNNIMGVLGSTEVYGATVGSVYGGYFTHMANTGTVTNGYGVYVGSVFGNNKWSLYSSDATAPNYFAGMVGIGTNAPSYSIDVIGTGGPRARVFSQDGNYAGYISKNTSREFFAGVQGTYEAANGTNSGYHIYDNTAGARRMVIDYLGRMGINNSAPTATLDVLGTFKLTDGSQGAGKVLTSDASGNATWSTSASSGWGLSGNAATTASINYIGTSDNNPLSFRVNGQAAGRIDHILQNVFMGYLSGFSNSTGANNAAVGTYALWLNTSGGGNSALGQSALYSNTTGLNNTATGYGALYGNTTGSLNTASGESALYQNGGGVENAAFGRASMYNNNGGSRNSAFGSGALYSNVGGTNNTAIGQQAGFSSASGSGNVFLGVNAGYYETTSNKLWISNSTTSTTPLIYGDFANGKVGINTSTGTANFQVNGTTRLVDGTQGAGKVLTSDASGNATWSTVATPSRVRSIVVEPGAMNITGAYAAAPATYSMVGGWQRPCVVFPDAATSQVQLHFAIPSDWNATSSFTVRILYGSPNTSGIFDMQTLTSNIGINVSAVTSSSGGAFTLSQSSTVEGLSEYQYVMSVTSTSKVLQFTLRRNGNSGTDTSTDPMRLYGIAIDYRD